MNKMWFKILKIWGYALIILLLLISQSWAMLYFSDLLPPSASCLSGCWIEQRAQNTHKVLRDREDLHGLTAAEAWKDMESVPEILMLREDRAGGWVGPGRDSLCICPESRRTYEDIALPTRFADFELQRDWSTQFLNSIQESYRFRTKVVCQGRFGSTQFLNSIQESYRFRTKVVCQGRFGFRQDF
ncbi:hypothetical protein C8R42DRAFT_645837 [Lentinula raphanica]|nr:hypothetical protein C8R42DRAFT_645837 [Lentinula raphanica]